VANLRTCTAFAMATLLAASLGCGDDDGMTPTDAAVDVRRPPIGGSSWETEVVATGHVGLHVRVAVVGGQAALAFFSTQARNDGPCTEIGTMDVPDRLLWDLHYAEAGAGTWSVEDVQAVLSLSDPPGLDFAAAPDGTPTIAALTGGPWVTPGIGYCGANDLGLYGRDGPGSWSADVAVATSGEAASGMPASDYGEVVGFWPGLAYDAAGQPAIVYRDVHAGGIQSDDFRRADLELTWRDGGGWRHIPVDVGRSAGSYNQLVFDGEGRPVIVYYLPMEATMGSQQGIWVARSSDDGATWEQVRLLAGPTSPSPDIVVDPSTGQLHVVYYDGGRGVPVHAGLVDSSRFTDAAAWDQEIFGDSRYDEGHRPSMAVGPAGILGVAYYRCTRATEGIGDCRAADDAVVFAFRERGAWDREVVDEGDDGPCGLTPSLDFEPDGSAVIGYMCSSLVDGSLDQQVRFGRRDPL